MPRPIISIREKLAKLERQAEVLLKNREGEIISIVKACSALTIDDHLLAGFLLFVGKEENKDHPILKEFTELAKTCGIPSRLRKPRSPNKKKQAITNTKTNKNN